MAAFDFLVEYHTFAKAPLAVLSKAGRDQKIAFGRKDGDRHCVVRAIDFVHRCLLLPVHLQVLLRAIVHIPYDTRSLQLDHVVKVVGACALWKVAKKDLNPIYIVIFKAFMRLRLHEDHTYRIGVLKLELLEPLKEAALVLDGKPAHAVHEWPKKPVHEESEVVGC